MIDFDNMKVGDTERIRMNSAARLAVVEKNGGIA